MEGCTTGQTIIGWPTKRFQMFLTAWHIIYGRAWAFWVECLLGGQPLDKSALHHRCCMPACLRRVDRSVPIYGSKQHIPGASLQLMQLSPNTAMDVDCNCNWLCLHSGECMYTAVAKRCHGNTCLCALGHLCYPLVLYAPVPVPHPPYLHTCTSDHAGAVCFMICASPSAAINAIH